jgi:hypothetical protein
MTWARSLFSSVFILLALVLVFCSVNPASAQTVNQTTCGGTNGISSCLNVNGFLQDLTVDCSLAAPAGLVATALAQIADREGPNRITLSNTCNAGFNVIGFDRLTIQGTATITRGVNIVNSRNILLKSLTFDFTGTSGLNLSLNGAQVGLDGVTLKNSSNNAGIFVNSASSLGFSGASSTVTGNSCIGIDVSAGSFLNLANATISNNGFAQGCGSQRHGVKLHNGGSANLSTQIVVNGTAVDALLDVSGNSGAGIDLEGSGTLTTNAEAGAIAIHIHNNGQAGILLFGAASADLEGNLLLDGNAPNGSDGFPSSQIIAASNASLSIGDGTVVHGGLAGVFNAFVIIGDGGPMTITGGASFSQGAVGGLSGANTIDTLQCDTTSWVDNFDNHSIIGTNNCPSSGPTGVQGPKGDVGPAGPPGPTTFTGSFTAAGSPGFLAMFASPTNVGNSSLFDNGTGSIGVGTSSPLDSLHVKFANTGGTATGLAVQNTGNTTSSYSGMLFYDQNGAVAQFQGFNNVTHEYRINNVAAAGSINFMLGSSSKFLVASSGNIGIGSASPAAKLQVAGDVRLGTSGTNGCVQAFDGSPIGGTCSSDRRLKQHIEPFGLMLDKIARLRPVSYDWNRSEHPDYQFGSGRTMGLIAQEVEQVFPGMVAEDDRGYKAVNYSQLPLMLLQAIRELKAENDSLRSRLEAQEEEIQRELETLKKRHDR